MVYYGSRFAPKPRRAAPARAAGLAPARTIADGLDVDSIVCIRIHAHGWATGRRIQHTIDCYDAGFRSVLLSADPARELEERAELLAAMFAAFPGIDWDYSHQIITGEDGTDIWAAPAVVELGGCPGEDRTFGPLTPPRYVADRPWHDNVEQLPPWRAAA